MPKRHTSEPSSTSKFVTSEHEAWVILTSMRMCDFHKQSDSSLVLLSLSTCLLVAVGAYLVRSPCGVRIPQGHPRDSILASLFQRSQQGHIPPLLVFPKETELGIMFNPSPWQPVCPLKWEWGLPLSRAGTLNVSFIFCPWLQRLNICLLLHQ